MSNRRDFVVTTLATGAVLNGLVTLPAAAAAPGSFGSIPSKAVFDTLTGQMLEVHASGRYQAELRLAAVHDRSCCARWEQFSLELRGGSEQPLPGGIYRLGHKTSYCHSPRRGSDLRQRLPSRSYSHPRLPLEEFVFAPIR
jgi:hypothetical protein